ncbi:MAG: hypothetical protein FJX64_07635 [Alphaproteobacteria bacterium]|nr:hypothetical protein [Alphaproteobacteria bacterium]
MKRIFVATVLLLSFAGASDAQPVPPCAGPADPPHSRVGEIPNVAVWYAEELRTWRAPACTGWEQSSQDAVAASAVRFRHAGSVDVILERFAKVSDYTEIPYWSPNNQELRTLIKNASALSGPDTRLRREDFTVAELAKGEPVFLHMGGNAVNNVAYRMQVLEYTPDKLTVALENAITVRVLGFPMVRAGGGQFLFSFERESPDVWRSYTLVRVGSLLNVVARPPMDQYANRAVALTRYFAGMPLRDPMPPSLLRNTAAAR